MAEPRPEPGSIDVLLVDTLGELLAFYAAGDVGFVGGSLVPVGGHNLLEPAALGKPVVCGPYSFNSPEAARLLDDAGALLRVQDAASLADGLQRPAWRPGCWPLRRASEPRRPWWPIAARPRARWR